MNAFVVTKLNRYIPNFLNNLWIISCTLFKWIHISFIASNWYNRNKFIQIFNLNEFDSNRWSKMPILMLATKLSHVLVSGSRKNLFLRLQSSFSASRVRTRNCLNMAYSVIERGSPFTCDYRVYISKFVFAIKIFAHIMI